MSRIYLVDDHPIVRESLATLLESRGHEVVGQSDDLTRSLSEIVRLSPEVVLLDLSVGSRSGLEILAQIKERGLSARVVVLSSSQNADHVAEAMQMGAAAYVLKGSPIEDLLSAVAAAAFGRTFLAKEESALAAAGRSGSNAGEDDLSPRERQIVVMVARGASSAEIGEELHLSPKTVDTYRSRLMAKLGLKDVPAVVRWAIRAKLIDANER
ncbi:response regulator transcription factor [Piscinibacter sp. HJYY11]|uniref:response regulator transcription factor n=1 Tax=Piscinibacter sp. HJYY11 TaxID=2801333 RepID=UPI00191F6B88|nr:response regulator transcription factor [Piscinibacter sp. HJYY11]MBL0727256.1 response regulator transcription factor [Piscinibacter sp. HJYY11]